MTDQENKFLEKLNISSEFKILFLPLWKAALQFNYYVSCHAKKGDKEKAGVNWEYAMMCLSACEIASNKTFVRLREVWEECK